MSIYVQGTLWRRNISENFNRLSMAHERYRQADRQTDGRRHSERELTNRLIFDEGVQKNVPFCWVTPLDNCIIYWLGSYWGSRHGYDDCLSISLSIYTLLLCQKS